MATRRAVLRQLALGLGVVACRGAVAQPADGAAYVGIETSAATAQSRAVFFRASGARVAVAPLDFRAHGMAQHGDTLVVFPRRPGNRFAALDLASLEVRAVVTAPADRHFYGHGAFSRDGRHLLVTENGLETLGGGIGVYEATGPMRRLGQVALPGPGPHDVVREPGGARFLIALGGLETHPAYGRTPLNLASFRSQVLSFDVDRGSVEEMGHWPGSEGVSLRHLARDGRGRLYVGGQHVDGAPAGSGDVLWLVEDGQAQPIAAGREMAGYVSSVAASGDRAVVTSKEAGRALTLDGDRTVATVFLDGASAAAMGPGITAVSGYASLDLGDGRAAATPGFEFDNHGHIVL